MASTFTITATRTSTFTEARVRYVMDKVLEDEDPADLLRHIDEIGGRH